MYTITSEIILTLSWSLYVICAILTCCNAYRIDCSAIIVFDKDVMYMLSDLYVLSFVLCSPHHDFLCVC